MHVFLYRIDERRGNYLTCQIWIDQKLKFPMIFFSCFFTFHNFHTSQLSLSPGCNLWNYGTDVSATVPELFMTMKSWVSIHPVNHLPWKLWPSCMICIFCTHIYQWNSIFTLLCGHACCNPFAGLQPHAGCGQQHAGFILKNQKT